MATKGKGSSRKVITVDFSGVEAGGLISEGPHLVEIVEAEVKESSSGNDYINLKVKCTEDDPESGRFFYHTCSLQPQALFNLRTVLGAIGIDVPNGAYQFEPEHMVGGVAQVEIVHETYEGKKRSKAAAWYPVSEEDETPEPAARKPKAEAPEPAPAPATTRKGPKKASDSGFAVGQVVSFDDDDGDEVTGKIVSLEGDKATVKVGKEDWEIDLSELKAA